MAVIRPSSAPPLLHFRLDGCSEADAGDCREDRSLLSNTAETVTPPDSPHTTPPSPPALYDASALAVSVSYPKDYTHIFTSRLLGFSQTIVDPALVTSYCPFTGLSHTLWTPAPATPPHSPTASPLPPAARLDTYTDPSCVIASIAGRLNPCTNSVTYGIFHGPMSPRNLAERIPCGKNDRKITRMHAEIRATERLLLQMIELLHGGADQPKIRNVVIVTDSRKLMHILSDNVYRWRAKGWTRSHGTRMVPNAAAWKSLTELVEKIEAHGVGVRIWTVAENVNHGAMMLAAAAESLAVPQEPQWSSQQTRCMHTEYGFQQPVVNNGCLACARY